jgi:hypothetical protein
MPPGIGQQRHQAAAGGKQHFRGRPPGQPCLQLAIVAMDDTAVFALGISDLSHFRSLR